VARFNLPVGQRRTFGNSLWTGYRSLERGRGVPGRRNPELSGMVSSGMTSILDHAVGEPVAYVQVLRTKGRRDRLSFFLTPRSPGSWRPACGGEPRATAFGRERMAISFPEEVVLAVGILPLAYSFIVIPIQWFDGREG
jgi:hypothetical protein